MTKPEALRLICKDDRSENLTRTSYKRVKRALDALGFTAEEQKQALMDLQYLDSDGNNNQFLK